MAVTARSVGAPLVLKTQTVQIKKAGDAANSDDFSDHIDSLILTPSATSTSWTSGNGKTLTSSAIATWKVTLSLVQDLNSSGLLRYLLTNEGKKAQILATLQTGADPILLDVTLTPAGVGGKADGSVASTSVDLPMDGKPNWAAGAAFTIV